jgi:hypothetical protein
MTSESTTLIDSPNAACPRCDRLVEESPGRSSPCPDCGFESGSKSRSLVAMADWSIRHRKPLLLAAGGAGAAAFAAAWPEHFSRWVLVLFAIVVAILVLAGVVRLPNGSYQLAAVLIVPALVMPMLWRYVSIGCFSAFVAVGMLTDSLKSRLKRSDAASTSQTDAIARML